MDSQRNDKPTGHEPSTTQGQPQEARGAEANAPQKYDAARSDPQPQRQSRDGALSSGRSPSSDVELKRQLHKAGSARSKKPERDADDNGAARQRQGSGQISIKSMSKEPVPDVLHGNQEQASRPRFSGNVQIVGDGLGQVSDVDSLDDHRSGSSNSEEEQQSRSPPAVNILDQPKSILNQDGDAEKVASGPTYQRKKSYLQKGLTADELPHPHERTSSKALVCAADLDARNSASGTNKRGAMATSYNKPLTQKNDTVSMISNGQPSQQQLLKPLTRSGGESSAKTYSRIEYSDAEPSKKKEKLRKRSQTNSGKRDDNVSESSIGSHRSASRQSEMKKQAEDEDKLKSDFDKKTEKERNAKHIRKIHMNEYTQMHKFNQYSQNAISRFPSLKDVLKKRVQFNETKKNRKDKILQRYKNTEVWKDWQAQCTSEPNPFEPKFEPKIIDITNLKSNRGRQEKREEVPHLSGIANQDDQETQQCGMQQWSKEYQEKLAQIKDETTFYVHGKYVQYSRRSYAIFENKNKLRIFLVWLITSPQFDYFITAMILLNSFFLGIKDYTIGTHDSKTNIFVEEAENVFTIIFVGEFIAKSIAMGFCIGSKSYLYDSWNWLDFTVVVTSILEVLPSMKNISGLRTFRLFRPLRSLTTMPSMRILIGTLIYSLSHLGGILGLAIFFFMIFAILGVTLWEGKIHYRCYETPDPFPNGTWVVSKTDLSLCSDYRPCAEGYYCRSKTTHPFFQGQQRLQNQSSDSEIKELNYGITNFDDCFMAFLTIFQCITMEGWTKIMNIYQDVYMSWFVSFYFTTCVIICSFFLLNLTIAVMLMKYEELDKKDKSKSQHKDDLRDIGKSIKLPEQLIEFLINQDSIQLSFAARKMLKQEDSFIKQLLTPKKPIVDLTEPYYQNELVSLCLKIVMNPYFDGVIMIVIILNTIFQSFDRHPELDSDLLQFFQRANYVFTCVFSIEVLLKMIGLGIRSYFAEKFNQFDFVVMVISIIEIEFEGHGVVSSLRGFRLFKIFKLFKVGGLRVLIDSITFTLATIWDYVILLILFIYVLALLGMQFFAGKIKLNEFDEVDPNGESPRANFDRPGWAILTVFQVLLSEGWNEIMYQCMRCTKSYFSAVYFLLLILSGNIIMLNLFLAILLGNFEKARVFGEKKKVFEAFKEIHNDGVPLNQQLDIILGEMSTHAKQKILKWDEVIVQIAHQTGETPIALELMEDGHRFCSDLFDDRCKRISSIGSSNGRDANAKNRTESLRNHMIELSYMDYEEKSQYSEEGDNEGPDNRRKRANKSIMEEEDERGELEETKSLEDSEDNDDEGTGSEEDQKKHDHEQSDDQDYVHSDKEAHGMSRGAFTKSSKEKKEQEQREKNQMKYSKIFIKHHAMNKRIHRMKELNRLYNTKPCKGLKHMLEKEHDLGNVAMCNVSPKQELLEFCKQQMSFRPAKHGQGDHICENTREQNVLKYQKMNNEEPIMSGLNSAISSWFNSNSPQSKKRMATFMTANSALGGKPDSAKAQHGKKKSPKAKEDEKDLDGTAANLLGRDDVSMARFSQKSQSSKERSASSLAKQPKSGADDKKSSSSSTKKASSWRKSTSQSQKKRTFSKSQTVRKMLELTSLPKEQKKSKNKVHMLQQLHLKKSQTSVMDAENHGRGNNDMLQHGAEELEIDQISESDKKQLQKKHCWNRAMNRMKDSSLLIFHKHGRIRRQCLLLAESPENVEKLELLKEQEQEEEEYEQQMKELANMKDKQRNQQNRQSFADKMFSSLRRIDDTLPHSQQELKQFEQMSKDRRSQQELYERKRAQQSHLLMLQSQIQSIQRNPTPSMNTFDRGKHGKNNKLQHPSKIFENIVLGLIVVSSITLCVDNPLNDPNGQVQLILGYIDYFFTLLFFIEAMIKIIAKGLLFNNMRTITPYLREAWNILDLFVVVAAVMDIVFTILNYNMNQLQALKALRALRALRPLRMISRNEGMRLIVNALLASLPSMANVMLVCILFILIFSIMGVSFFKGKFYSCHDRWDAEEKIDMKTINDKEDCLEADGLWLRKKQNFDNAINAMITLFSMTQAEGWVEVMYDGLDARGVDLQPKKNENLFTIVYFIGFMIIGSQFIINLFVGVVIDNFNTIKEQEELGNMFVTQSQKSWIELQKMGLGKSLKTKMKEPIGPRAYFFRLVTNKYFEYIITFFIVINSGVMAMRHHNMKEELTEFSKMSNYVFSVVFNLEMILKLIGLGSVYFKSNWNCFDMFIVIASDLGFLLDLFNVGGGFATAATVIRSVRIMRMARLIKSSQNIRLILDTILNILPQIGNVVSLIVLLFFIYAALAVNFFSDVMLQDYLDEKNNFQSWADSMIVLMKFSTGEDWNMFMYELANQDSYNGVKCKRSQTYEEIQKAGRVMGCGTYISYPYFISFTILVSMLIMNLSVAAVIEGLDTAKKENMGIVQSDQIDTLIDLWQEYDIQAEGWISMEDLVFLLYDLPSPLGRRIQIASFKNENKLGMSQKDRYLVNEKKDIVIKKIEALELLRGLKIKVYDNSHVHFADVFKALMKRILSENQIDYKLSSNHNKQMKNKWSKKHNMGQNMARGSYTVREEQAAYIITRWAKKQLNRQMNLLQLKKNDAKQKRQLQKKKAQSKTLGSKEKVHQRADTQKIAGERQKRRHEMIKENARIIFNIINGIEDSFEKSSQEGNNLLLTKNEYTWCNKNNHQMLEKLDKQIFDDNYDSDMDEAEKQAFEERYRQYQQQREQKEKEGSLASRSQANEAALFSKYVLAETANGREGAENAHDLGSERASQSKTKALSVITREQRPRQQDGSGSTSKQDRSSRRRRDKVRREQDDLNNDDTENSRQMLLENQDGGAGSASDSDSQDQGQKEVVQGPQDALRTSEGLNLEINISSLDNNQKQAKESNTEKALYKLDGDGRPTKDHFAEQYEADKMKEEERTNKRKAQQTLSKLGKKKTNEPTGALASLRKQLTDSKGRSQLQDQDDHEATEVHSNETGEIVSAQGRVIENAKEAFLEQEHKQQLLELSNESERQLRKSASEKKFKKMLAVGRRDGMEFLIGNTGLTIEADERVHQGADIGKRELQDMEEQFKQSDEKLLNEIKPQEKNQDEELFGQSKRKSEVPVAGAVKDGQALQKEPKQAAHRGRRANEEMNPTGLNEKKNKSALRNTDNNRVDMKYRVQNNNFLGLPNVAATAAAGTPAQNASSLRKAKRARRPSQLLTAENFPTDIDIVDKERINDIREELDKVQVPEQVQIEEQQKSKQTQLELEKKLFEDYIYGSPSRLRNCRSRPRPLQAETRVRKNPTLNSFSSNFGNLLSNEIGNQVQARDEQSPPAGKAFAAQALDELLQPQQEQSIPSETQKKSYYAMVLEGKKLELKETAKERVFQQALLDVEASTAVNARGKLRRADFELDSFGTDDSYND